VVFERADGPLGIIAAVDVGRRQLEVYPLEAEKLLQVPGGLIIQEVDLGMDAASGQVAVYLFDGRPEGQAGPGFEGLGNDRVAIVVVDN
jgi:hypothetical protein